MNPRHRSGFRVARGAAAGLSFAACMRNLRRLWPRAVTPGGREFFDRRLTATLRLAALALALAGLYAGLAGLQADRGAGPLAFLVGALVLIVASGAAVLVLLANLERTLRQARRSEERYRLITEVASDYTFSSTVDAAGRVRQEWVAGAFEAMTGYDFAEYAARGGWRAALHPDDFAEDDRALAELQANRPVLSEVRTRARDGRVRWVRVYARPVWDPEPGRLRGIYGAVQDVTERRQADAQRDALIRELELKNSELERFTYTVSHDLKSPLVTVRGFLGFVERDAVAGNHERLRADLARIRDATERMGRLLDELLELSRVGRVMQPAGPVAWGELAQAAVALLAGPIAERGVEVVVAADLPTVWGDRTRLLQVLQNLVDNAVKFAGDAAQPRVEIGVRREPGAHDVLFVRDNGIGIEQRHLGRVFGLFEKLDADSRGTGIGLALVERIVALHDGRVWAESDGPGRGTTVCLTLPTGAPNAD